MDNTKNDDILLDSNGDIYIDSDTYDFVMTKSIKQAIEIRLKWFVGEWVYHTDFGIPYYEDVFIKNPSESHLSLIFANEINAVDGVDRVENMKVDIDSKTRVVHISFTAYTEDGIKMSENINVEV